MTDSDPEQSTYSEVDAKSPNCKSETKGPISPPDPPFRSQIPPSPIDKKDTCICRPDQTPPWKVALECLAVLVGAFAVAIYGGQLAVMRGTLAEMQRSGEQSTTQMWSAIGNINWMARSMDWSQKVGKKAMESSEQQSQKALQAAIDQFRLDQRAWVGVEDISCHTCEYKRQSTARNGNPIANVSLTIQGFKGKVINTGKTPAEDVHVQFTLHLGTRPVFTSCTPETPSQNSMCQASFDDPSIVKEVMTEESTHNPFFSFQLGPIAPGQSRPVIFAESEYFSQGLEGKDFDQMVAGYVQGKLTYTDIWNKLARRIFASSHIPIPGPKNTQHTTTAQYQTAIKCIDMCVNRLVASLSH